MVRESAISPALFSTSDTPDLPLALDKVAARQFPGVRQHL
jgi:hypothetical protein